MLYFWKYINYVFCLLKILEITVTFDNTLYSVNENDGVIQPTLLLSNPSIFFESVQVISADITAIGMA